MMKFVFPNLAYRQQAIDFIHEMNVYHSEINGCGSLDVYLKESTYEAWLEKVLADIDLANIQPGRVPALTYFYVSETDDAIIGMINIRLALNEFLKKEGGHIGYCVRPAARNQRHATNMLKEALDFCRVIGLNHIILTCDRDNPASAHVIQHCGGQLEAEFYSDFFQQVIQRYVICPSPAGPSPADTL